MRRVLLAALLFFGGCGFLEDSTDSVPGDGLAACNTKTSGEVAFELLERKADKPANVLLSFGVRTCDGEPLVGLGAADFIVTEDNAEISAFESDQTILAQNLAFELYTLLILDMSGSIINSGNLPPLQAAAKAFVQAVAGKQAVAIALFDGREELVPLTQDKDGKLLYSADTATLEASLEALTNYQVVDNSTNLNGAIVKGLSALDQRIAAATKPISIGSLIVFTDGTDQAARVSEGGALNHVRSTRHGVYAIGLGGETDQAFLTDVGKSGLALASDSQGLASAFSEISDQLARDADRFYLLGYCTPKRAGTHTITISVKDREGFMTASFNADGFEPGCSSDAIVKGVSQ